MVCSGLTRRCKKLEAVAIRYEQRLGPQAELAMKLGTKLILCLGLSVSYGIVKDHGGSIRVESELGRFTRFMISLPFTVSRAAADASPAQAVAL
jgi:hypothetical protein